MEAAESLFACLGQVSDPRMARLTGVCKDRNWSEDLESARESGILVAVTKPGGGGLPCAFPGNATG